jgi:hypothetical protein
VRRGEQGKERATVRDGPPRAPSYLLNTPFIDDTFEFDPDEGREFRPRRTCDDVTVIVGETSA